METALMTEEHNSDQLKNITRVTIAQLRLQLTTRKHYRDEAALALMGKYHDTIERVREIMGQLQLIYQGMSNTPLELQANENDDFDELCCWLDGTWEQEESEDILLPPNLALSRWLLTIPTPFARHLVRSLTRIIKELETEVQAQGNIVERPAFTEHIEATLNAIETAWTTNPTQSLDEIRCPVCMDGIEEMSGVVLLQCMHMWCAECWVRGAKVHGNNLFPMPCPTCREPIQDHNDLYHLVRPTDLDHGTASCMINLEDVALKLKARAASEDRDEKEEMRDEHLRLDPVAVGALEVDSEAESVEADSNEETDEPMDLEEGKDGEESTIIVTVMGDLHRMLLQRLQTILATDPNAYVLLVLTRDLPKTELAEVAHRFQWFTTKTILQRPAVRRVTHVLVEEPFSFIRQAIGEPWSFALGPLWRRNIHSTQLEEDTVWLEQVGEQRIAPVFTAILDVTTQWTFQAVPDLAPVQIICFMPYYQNPNLIQQTLERWQG